MPSTAITAAAIQPSSPPRRGCATAASASRSFSVSISPRALRSSCCSCITLSFSALSRASSCGSGAVCAGKCKESSWGRSPLMP